LGCQLQQFFRVPSFAPAALGSRLYSESPVALGINEVSMK